MVAIGACHQDGLVDEASVVVQPSRQAQIKSADTRASLGSCSRMLADLRKVAWMLAL